MKILIVFLILALNITHAQNLSDEEKNQILIDFHSEDPITKMESHRKIMEYKIIEVLPEVENTIFNQPLLFKIDYLWILYTLESPNVKNKALLMLDSTEYYDFTDQVITADEFKTEINEVLLKLGETGGVETVFQNSEESPSKTESLIHLLDNPQYENRAKNELINLAIHSEYESNAAITALEYKYPNEICDIYKNIIRYHPDFSERKITFDDLVSRGCSGLREFINERISNEPNKAVRYEMARILITKLNQLQDYKKYIDYHNWEQDTICKGMSGFDIDEFIPVKPESNIQPIIILDSLKSYASQCNSFSWLGNQDYYSSLTSQLNAAKTYLNSGDLINTSKTISSFQKSIDKEYHDISNTTPSNFVTKEGWKYLYYYSQYLLDRLPIPPRTFNLNININGNGTVDKTPSLAEYDSSSTVTLTAKPAAGYLFKAWSGDYSSTSPTISLVMNSNKTLTAEFIVELPKVPVLKSISPGIALKGMGAFTLTVKGSLFAGGAVIYWNGSARTTTFVSDSVLTASIPAADIANTGNFNITVKNTGSTASNAIQYKVVSTLSAAVTPYVDCVTKNTDGTYTAYFGYNNANTSDVLITVGTKNTFSPTPIDRGQTTIFKKGRQTKVFSVKFTSSTSLAWTLNGRKVTATKNSTLCK